jgi:extracellular elastinolytic metalloproteinase
MKRPQPTRLLAASCLILLFTATAVILVTSGPGPEPEAAAATTDTAPVGTTDLTVIPDSPPGKEPSESRLPAPGTLATGRPKVFGHVRPRIRQPLSSEGSVVFVSGPAARPAADPLEAVESALRKRGADEGFAPEDFDGLIVTGKTETKRNGVTHLYLRQRYLGIEVYNGDANANVAKDGTILSLHSRFVRDLRSEINRTEPVIDAAEAVVLAARDLGVAANAEPQAAEATGGPDRKVVFEPGDLSRDPIPAKLMFFPQPDQTTRLVWNTVLHLKSGAMWMEINVDAENGAILSRANWYAHADYRVFPLPYETPLDGPRTLETDPHDPTASPFGWHDTNGAAGAEFADTRGNNVNAQDDTDDNDTGGSRPDGGGTLSFDNPLDLAQAPSTYLNAAITNLFYWNNLLHDIHYQYGFDEASGNFQENNYGNGGAGSDPVEADAQDGSGTNNANFGTPPDGFNPRMQMFVWTGPDPDRDSDLDNVIIIHEYGHGVSNRLTGGPANSSALSASQSGGMGEGWSDWWGLALTAKPGQPSNLSRSVGYYVLGQPTTGAGIRPRPYTTDMAVNEYTYGDIQSGLSIPHGIGFVWCSILWEVYWELVNAHGYDPDVYQGTGGNNLALQLVMDGLKLQPATPTYLEARDAILLADQVNNGGANLDLLWTAFAKRGLGFSASDSGDPNSLAVTEAFDLPDELFTIDDVTITEGHSGTQVATFTVTLAPEAVEVTTVDFATAPGTATAPADFTGTSGTLTFLVGESSKTIPVTLLGDSTPEEDETFSVILSNAVNGRIEDGEGTGTILNDDYIAPVINSPLTAAATERRPFTYQITALNTPRSFSLPGSPPAGMTIDTATGLVSWTPPSAGSFNVQIAATNPAGTDTETLVIQAADDPIKAAIDLDVPVSTGTPPWFSQSITTHDGTDAAQSGIILHNESTYFEITVTGPDTVRFWWKVSSEAGFDFLVFSDEGTPIQEISGEQDWQQIVYAVPAGTRTLGWSYLKDGGVVDGADAGWVDEVSLSSLSPRPYITSPSIAGGIANQPFSHQITTEQPATSFSSGTLPPGLLLNPGTGLVSGTPSASGTFPVQITATNAVGSDSQVLTISITPENVVEFTNAAGISIPSSGTATPYPSPILVSGMSGSIAALRVQIAGLSHTYPDDLDIFLVSPSGQVCALFSDAGGGTAATNLNLLFDDGAADPLPDDAPLSSGTFRPSNHTVGGTESLPPGGTGTIGTSLAALVASGSVNGSWNLFVTDDAGGDSGMIDSWSLLFELGSATAPEIAVSGNSAGIADGDTTPDPADHTDFGTTFAASGTVVRTFAIANTGTAPLNLGTVSIGGPHSADFTVNTQPGTPVQAGEATSFLVTFDPSAVGVRSATVSFSTDDGDENPFDFAIVGVGDSSPPTDIALSHVTLAENLGPNAPVGTLTASDADAGDSHAFSLVPGSGDADNLSFSISGTTLSLVPPADFEAKNSYSLRVRATDNGNPNLFFERPFTVTIADVNEAPTDIALGNSSVPENSPPGTTVGILGAVDPDQGANHTYTLVNGSGDADNLSFAISGATLRLIATADFETKPLYSIRLRATDNGVPGLSREEEFTVTVTNVNEPPVVTLTGANRLTFEAAATYGDPGATASDPEDGALDPDLTHNVVPNVPGAYSATWTATDAGGLDGSATRTVIVEDTTAPTLVPPGDLEVSATSAAGAVVHYPNATVTDNAAALPAVIYSPPSGSALPIGRTIVLVTATDGQGNASQASFTVTVSPDTALDKKTPAIRITLPTARTTTVAGPFDLEGTVSENFALRSFTVKFNGAVLATDSPLDLDLSSTAPWKVSGLTPENGPNRIEVEAVDLAGRIARATKTVTYVDPALAGRAGIYEDLVEPDGAAAPGIDTSGAVTVTLNTRGGFSGTARLAGATLRFSGVLRSSGAARFLPGLTDTLPLRVGRGASARTIGILALEVGDPGGLEGTVVSATDASAMAAFTGVRAPYTKVNPVPDVFLNLPIPPSVPSKGAYNVVFPSRDQVPPVAADQYPQGDGIGHLALSRTGGIRLAGYLADGTKYTFSARLRADDSAALFAQLYGKKGGLGGELAFNPGLPSTDVSGTGFLWLRPANPLGRQYVAGWPNGLTLDAAGTFFARPASLDFAQGTDDLLLGNAEGIFTDGKLAAPVERDVNISPLTGGVTKIPATDATWSLKLNPATGGLTGSFTHEDLTKPLFRGILLNKGANRGGFGYFLSSGVGGESGGVSLDPEGP